MKKVSEEGSQDTYGKAHREKKSEGRTQER